MLPGSMFDLEKQNFHLGRNVGVFRVVGKIGEFVGVVSLVVEFHAVLAVFPFGVWKLIDACFIQGLL